MSDEVDKSLSKISRIHSLSQDFLIAELSKKGLDDFASSHGNILFQLSKTPQMKMNELSEKINRDKSTTTILVQKLISERLVKVEKDSVDKRSRIISLTKKGREYNKKISNISKSLNKIFYDGFSEEEKIQFSNFLARSEYNFFSIFSSISSSSKSKKS